MRKMIAAMVAAAMVAGLSSCVTGTGESSRLPEIDMTGWHYEAADDVYWQTGLSYAANPADSRYETMGLFVPGAYFTGTDNGDGTFTCTVNREGRAGEYTALNAPYVIPVNTPGYSAMSAPTGYGSSMGYGSVSDYTDAGIIVIFAGARGRDEGAPAGVTDFKAAIRYTRYNKALLPGDTASVFSLGMSGGGAQSALIGATGNSDLYDPYLEAIGAVMSESDAVKGSMCWCPITNLDVADEAYEWNMGSTRSGLSNDEQLYSDKMAEAFAAYINRLNLTDSEGNVLTLTESETGIFQSGSYYEYVKGVIETSLEHFLSDTVFPYTVTSGGGRGNGPAGDRPMRGGDALPPLPQGGFEALDGIERNAPAAPSSYPSGTFESTEDYISALNASGKWVSLDEVTNKVTITDVESFTRVLKSASKAIAAFDQLDRGQGENILFGYGDGSGAHFDPILASIVADSEYGEAFEEDLAKKDALGNTVDVRMNMYNPMYYIYPYYEGYESSDVAEFWRIRTGINQGDTALCTEINLALALESFSGVSDVDFETVWGQGHVMAERAGSSTENFIAWVSECMK